jgi:serine/threonine-protein kinase
MRAGQEIGPFAIDSEIGSGAMGTVYQGRYLTTGQTVALKVIAAGYDSHPTALARFEREAEILKKLHHANIVRLYATGSYRKTPFYVMEFVEGESLEAALTRRGRLTWEEVVAVGRQVCAALQHAHEKGIVHRDLKPANIMQTPDGTAKLTDFGIAKGLESTQLTGTNCTVGTASYMSPEQCRGERDLTFKSDLYSLGVVFYELLTGRRPFTAETTLKMFIAHTEERFERPSRHVMDIPVWLDTLVCQLMEKDPGKRPRDAVTVARALEEIAEKVAAQRSAGVEVATGRRIDVPKSRRPKNESDREAARLLRESITKKKLPRRKRPFYERAAFVGGAIALLLLGLGGMLWWVLRPPTPEQLYEQAQSYMASGSPEEREKAREGPIAAFLKHYPRRNDPHAVQMRDWADQVDVRVRERQLQSRMRLKFSPEDEAEAAAHNAVRYEEAGELTLAADRWESLLKYREDPDAGQRPWGLLAASRLEEIRDAQRRDQALRKEVDDRRYQAQAPEPPELAERWAISATRAELFEDWGLALENWKRVRSATPSDAGGRALGLLAACKVRELDPRAPRGPDVDAKRRELVRSRLDVARALKGDKAHEGRALCRDVIALYGSLSDPELKPLVERAEKLLAELTPPG